MDWATACEAIFMECICNAMVGICTQFLLVIAYELEPLVFHFLKHIDKELLEKFVCEMHQIRYVSTLNEMESHVLGNSDVSFVVYISTLQSKMPAVGSIGEEEWVLERVIGTVIILNVP